MFLLDLYPPISLKKKKKPRENVFGKRHKIMFGMRQEMNKQTGKGLETSNRNKGQISN